MKNIVYVPSNTAAESVAFYVGELERVRHFRKGSLCCVHEPPQALPDRRIR